MVQLTTEADVPGCHLYMEAQVFTPDSKRLLLHRSAHPHGADPRDPEHRYMVCDLEDGCSLTPLTDELGARAPSVAPDGECVYYFVDETEIGGGSLELKRVDLNGRDRQTLMVVDAPLPGADYRPSRIYPLSTISSDGQRLALSCFLGNGEIEPPPWGLMVFDLHEATVELILEGPSWCNVHPQYCRAEDPQSAHDIMVQENHGNQHAADGTRIRLVGGDGADVHVVRDDGTDFRNMPWGRDGNEFCQGHQCWRGRSRWAITSTMTKRPHEEQLMESRAVPHAGHVGLRTSGGERNDLTREFPGPCFHHFASDIRGRRLITDGIPHGEDNWWLYLADPGEPGAEPLRNFRRVLDTESSLGKKKHVHPFLSPDGRLAFFNSDASGVLQAYMVRLPD